MYSPLLFGRYLCRLVWLVLTSPAAVDDQKAALRALVALARTHTYGVRSEDGRVYVDDAAVSVAMSGAQELSSRMHGSAVHIAVLREASGADLLALARWLKSLPAFAAGAALSARAVPSAPTLATVGIRLGLSVGSNVPEAASPLDDAVRAAAADDVAVLVCRLRYGDEPERCEAAVALGGLGTRQGSVAVHALCEAVRDRSPRVRANVANVLARLGNARTSVVLSRALDTERDADVQHIILDALGRLATPEAVDKLVQAAGSGSKIFRSKPVNFRVAAVHALGRARTPVALAALQTMASDRDPEVQDAVLVAVMHAPSDDALGIS
jgi:hypothetical protein